MIGYHFTGKTLRDGRPIPPIGEWLIHLGPIEPCRSGLHASEQPLDALRYAPGPLLHRVELVGELVPHGEPVDKWVGRRRRILATVNAESILRDFARWCARSVLDQWDAPQVVRDWLETGNLDLQSAAESAAWSAAKSAAWSAAREAAESAAKSAAREAAKSAAWEAAWEAAESAAESAAREAAWSAAWSAAREAQSHELMRIVTKALGERP
jgi:hypothetical protein